MRRSTSERERCTATAVQEVVLARWPGGVVPPLAGGRLFRALADRWDCSEQTVSDAARKAGAWPWKPEDVARAKAARADRGGGTL